MKFRILVLFLLISTIHFTTAQPQDPPSPQNLTDHYNLLIENSESYNKFKVIPETQLNAFWSVVKDSVNQLKNRISEHEIQIAQLQAEIAQLNDTISENVAAISTSEFENTHIRFLGGDFSKTFFVTTTILVVGGLLLLMLVGSFQYNHNKRIAREKLHDFNDLESTFDEFRKNSLEKQVRLKRELQTERNKVEEFQSKTTIRKKLTA